MMTEYLKILMVEENKYRAQLIEREIARQLGSHLVRTSGSEPVALGKSLENKYDVAIVDLCLSDGNGIDILRLIHRMRSELPIIAIVGRDDGQMVAEATSAGAVECVIDDYTFPQAFPDVIKRVLWSSELVLENPRDEIELRDKAQIDVMKTAAGTLSHEINNPLMAILGMSELILNERSRHDQEVIRKVRIIQRSARRIKSTLKQLSIIEEPITRQTASGTMIDPRQSRVTSKP